MTKTQQALHELSTILKEISADGIITKDEFMRVMQWRVRWSTVVRREEIRPFDNWFKDAIADNLITKDERDALIAWTAKIEALKIEEGEAISADCYLQTPRESRPTWGDDPATMKQVQFLIQLGHPESQCHGLTKGKASSLIDELLEKRNQRSRSWGA